MVSGTVELSQHYLGLKLKPPTFTAMVGWHGRGHQVGQVTGGNPGQGELQSVKGLGELKRGES